MLVVFQSNFHDERVFINSIEIQLARRLFSKAKFVVFASFRNKEMCEHQIASDINSHKALIIRASTEQTNFSRLPYDLPNRSTSVFCVMSRFEIDLKGHDILLRTLSLKKWRERDWILNLYGDGRDKQHIKELIYYYSLSNKIFFKGYTNNLSDAWKSNQMLIMPSISEGTPIVMMIAMGYGRPCLVTDVAGNAELIEDNITGFVAKAPTVDLLDEALERAWKQRHKWEEIGVNAYKWTIKNLEIHPENTLYKLITEKN